MAPEIFDEKPYSSKTDTYAFAIIMWEIFSEKTPYYNLSSPQAIIKFVYYENGRPDLKDLMPNTPPMISELIERNWDKDITKRMEFREIIEVLMAIDKNFD